MKITQTCPDCGFIFTQSNLPLIPCGRPKTELWAFFHALVHQWRIDRLARWLAERLKRFSS